MGTTMSIAMRSMSMSMSTTASRVPCMRRLTTTRMHTRMVMGMDTLMD